MGYEDLVLRGKAGDKEALDELIRKFTGYIIKCANNVYINGYTQEDLIQEGYVSLVKAVDKYDPKRGNFTAYVTFAIKKNFNYKIRGKARENYIGSLDYEVNQNTQLLDMLSTKENIEEDYVKNEVLGEISKVINNLPKELREVIDYYYISNKGSLKEYAEEKNINYSTLIRRKSLALKIIKNNLKDVHIIE